MIVVTGATGALGSQIVNCLLERIPATQVAASVRAVESAAGLAARGVRVRHGDFSDARSLSEAFADASTVLIVSSNSAGAEAVAQHTAAIDAAYAAGAHRVVYTSHQASAADSLFAPMRDHAATEAYLAGQERPFTSLRNGFYASTVHWLIGQAATTGTIIAPADGAVSWTTHADLAEAAAIIALEPELFPGATQPLTARDAVDLAGVAAIVSDLTGRKIRRVVVDDDEWKAAAMTSGVPEAQADFLLGMFRASRRGEFNVTDPALEQVLGKAPTPLRTELEAALANAE